jgi:hypothetical protein
MAKDIRKIGHKAFLERLPDYETLRDCYNGERAIKEKQTKYLPALKNQSQEDYANYLTRALFFPITGKTCSTMVGLATTKPPKVDHPESMSAYFVDTENGYQFTELYVSIMNEVVLMGRHGVLVDGPTEGGTDPIPVQYNAENIVNWGPVIGGRLQWLLLRECVMVPVEGSEFETKEAIRYRHCYLAYVDGGWTYWVQEKNDDLENIGPPIMPLFAGQPIDFIPFVCFGATGVHIGVDKPPMLDISTINISHYLTSADLEWGRHIVGLPTPVVSGVDSGTTLKIGGTAAWVLPPPEAKAYYMEFLGTGLGSLEKAMSDKIGLMASMSARLVDNSTRGSEAAETVRLRYMSEAASLIHIISSTETGFVVLFNMIALLTRAQGTVSVKFSREILGTGIAFKDLSTLIEGYLTGAISKETLLFNLRRLDAVDPNLTDAEILAGMRDPPPPAVNQPAKPPVAA